MRSTGRDDRRKNSLRTRWLRTLVAPGLLIAGLVGTGLVVRYLKVAAEEEARRELFFTANEVEHNIGARLRACEQVLRSGAGLFDTLGDVGRDDWRTFVSSLRIEENLPGIQGVGFSRLVPAASLAEHEQEVRNAGFPDYRLWPAGAREIYSSIVYLEPFANRNLRAFGYDMFSEPIRRRAMERARDEQTAALSGKVILVQETGVGVQAGTLLYYPVYRRGVALATVSERRGALVGWVYSPYRMTDLIKGALGGWESRLRERRIDFQIYDGETLANENLLFDNGQAGARMRETGADFVRLVPVAYAGRHWMLRFAQQGGLAAAAHYDSTWFALSGGMAISLLVAGLTLSLQRTSERAEAKADRLTQELRQTTERLELATRTGGVGVWDHDVLRNELLWDDQMARLYGLAPGEFHSFFEAFHARLHPEDRPRVKHELNQALQGAKEFKSEFRVLWPDEQCRHIRAFGVVQFDEAGRAVRMVGTNWDITESKQAHLEIEKSQTRLALAMSLAQLAPWEFDATSGHFTFDDAFYALYATTAEREGGARMALETYAREFLPSEEQHLVASCAARLLSGEVEDLTVEHRIIRRDGAVRFLAVKIIAIRDQTGRINGLRGANQDITELREKDRQLADRDDRWRAALLATMDGYIETDPAGGILAVNPAYETLSGFTETELTSMNMADLEFGSLATAPAERCEEIQRLGNKRFRAQHRRKGGGVNLVEASATYSPRFGGRFYYFYRDVTAQQEAERRLLLQTTALESAANTVVITDASGTIEWVNDAFVRATGYSREEVIGRNPRILKSGQHPAEHYQKMWRTILSGQVWRGELVNRRKDGSVMIEESTITPVSSAEGRITHLVAIKQDITERKNIERKLLRSQRMEAVGLLAGGIAHDLNNILTPVLLSIELLKPRLSTAEDRQTLDMVELSARRGAGIVRQVLTFARGIEGERVPIRPVDLVREVAAMAAETFPREISIVREAALETPPIAGDITQLHQVLLNLAVNARDAMPGGGTLSLVVECTTLPADYFAHTADLKAGAYVVLKVRDTGHGMSPEVKHRIFEPFFTTKPLGKGTGLGLSTALGIIRSHGGAIDFQSEVGRGSEFRIYLPALTQEVGDDPAGGGPLTLDGKGRTVMVVDDEPFIRALVRIMLARMGFKVLEAGNGREALALYAESSDRIDAVITDIMMPAMSGEVLAGELWRHAPNLPILFMSGLTDQLGASLGKVHQREIILVRKPFESHEFLRLLARVFDGARQTG